MKTKILTMMLAAVIAFVGLAFQPAAAQSGGCPNGPHAGATATDSDGDGVADADEVVSGTDECDPDDTPTLVCGQYVANYNANSFDFDNDGFTDAEEDAAGADKCDSTSVVSSAAAQPPLLALTGPSTTILLAFAALILVSVGGASVAVGRRTDA